MSQPIYFLESSTLTASFSTAESIQLTESHKMVYISTVENEQHTSSPSSKELSHADPVVSTKPSMMSNERENDAAQIPVVIIVSLVLIFLICLLVVTATILLFCIVIRKRHRGQGHHRDKVVSKPSIDNPVYDGQMLRSNKDYVVPVIINPAYNLHTILPTPTVVHDYELCRSSPVEYLKPIRLFKAIQGTADPVKSKQLGAFNDRALSTDSAIYEIPLTPSYLDAKGSRDSREPEHYELAVNVVDHSNSEVIAHTHCSNSPIIYSPGYDVPSGPFQEYCSETSDFTGIDRIDSGSNDKIREDVKSWIYQNDSNTLLTKL